MDALTPCPICLATESVERDYALRDGGAWPGCTNCEAAAPLDVWTALVKARQGFDAR